MANPPPVPNRPLKPEKMRTNRHWSECYYCNGPVSKYHDRLDILPDGYVIDVCNNCYEAKHHEPFYKRFLWHINKLICVGQW